MTQQFEFRKGDMLEVRNASGELITWGSFESEDKVFTFLRQIQPATRKPHWKFDIGRYPHAQFAFIRMPDRNGDFHLLTRALREQIELFANWGRSREINFPPYCPAPQQIKYAHPRFVANLEFRALANIEFVRLRFKKWRQLKFEYDREHRLYQDVHGGSLEILLMNPKEDPAFVISRVVRGNWYVQTREQFLDTLERMKSPHLNLLRESLGRKKLKNEGVEHFPRRPRQIDW